LISATTTVTSASLTAEPAERVRAWRRGPEPSDRPGVSTMTTWAEGSLMMPKMRLRVVWGLGVTMATLVPTN
jgi:hypothetical protein